MNDTNTRIGKSSIHNQGLFANISFNVGDVVLSECPLFICDYLPDDTESLQLDVILLSKAIPLISKPVMDSITGLYCPSNQSVFARKAESLIEVHKSKLSSNIDVLTNVLMILFVNGLTIRIQDFLHKESIVGSALFSQVSRANHSCLPNTEWCTIRDNKDIKIVLKAVQPIRKDDEIFISYFSHTHSYRDRQFRQTFLKNGWNFMCKCCRCSSDTDDVRRFESSDHVNGYYCAKHDQNECTFISSELWHDINNCDLSKYGTRKDQLQVIKDSIAKLEVAGLHSSHYLFLELSYPLAALSDNKREILSALINRSVLMQQLIAQPNVRRLVNEMEIVSYLKKNIDVAIDTKVYVKHIREGLKLSYILYPAVQHPYVKYFRDLLLKTEKHFIKNNIDLKYECNVCVICQKQEISNRCSRCLKAYYCCVAHQKTHWVIHKLKCKK